PSQAGRERRGHVGVRRGGTPAPDPAQERDRAPRGLPLRPAARGRVGGRGRLAWSAVLTAITAAINVASSLILIILVLLHSGKGGGLSDMFGGGIGASALGSTV